MSPHRFYAPHLTQLFNSPQSRGTLDAAEARHAISVLRLKPGDAIQLFDGVGRQADAHIISVSKQFLEFETIACSEPVQSGSHCLTLAIALPKGDRQKTLIDAATEIGVSKLIPLKTERGVAQPTESALERLQRAVIEACKQSGRNQLMEIATPQSIADLSRCETIASSPLRLVAHPYAVGSPPAPMQHYLAQHRPQSTVIAVGPEGGLTDDEVGHLQSIGWQSVSLGPMILRIEIAALVASALATAWMREEPSMAPIR